jgi:hypothetical protein
MKAQREIFKNTIVTKYAAKVLHNWASQIHHNNNLLIFNGADDNCH